MPQPGTALAMLPGSCHAESAGPAGVFVKRLGETNIPDARLAILKKTYGLSACLYGFE